MMQSSEKKARINIDCEKREGGDANAVFQDHHKQAAGDEQNLVPKAPKTKVCHEERQDEQCHTGTDTAALLSHFDADLRQVKDQTFTQDWDSRQVEQDTGYPRGALLKKKDQAIEKKTGDGNHQEKKQKWE